MRPVKPAALKLLGVRGAIAPALILAALAASCAWDPWVPGERSWNPEVVADPSTLAERIPLDHRHVGELDCYAQRCQKRYRIVVEEPGQLTVRMVPELSGPDARARLVLESLQGPIGQAGSDRGPQEDVTILAVREVVEPGVFFVLLQSVGGPMPFELEARLTPGEGPAPGPSVARPTPPPTPPTNPPARMVKVSLPRLAGSGGGAGAGYDPAVAFDRLHTFAFPAPVLPGPDTPAGTRVDQPIDREIRRLLADGLRMRGLRQATGSEPPDLRVHFTRQESIWSQGPLVYFYDWYGFGTVWPGAIEYLNQRGTLTVDLVETRGQRLAWHAWTTKGLGPGVTPGERTTQVIREAVSDLLSRFPPR